MKKILISGMAAFILSLTNPCAVYAEEQMEGQTEAGTELSIQAIAVTEDIHRVVDVLKTGRMDEGSAGSMHAPGMGTITGNQHRRTGPMPGTCWNMEASCPATWYGSQEADRAAGYI